MALSTDLVPGIETSNSERLPTAEPQPGLHI